MHAPHPHLHPFLPHVMRSAHFWHFQLLVPQIESKHNSAGRRSVTTALLFILIMCMFTQ